MTRLVYALSMPMLLVAVLVASSLPRSHPAAVEFLPHGMTASICDGGPRMESSRAPRNGNGEQPANATVGVLEFLAVSTVVVDLLAEGAYPAMPSRHP
jgi:hypothetical protein